MLSQPLVLLGLLAAVTQAVADPKPEGHARHMQHLQHARMLKKRVSPNTTNTTTEENPCKRDAKYGNTGSLTSNGNGFAVVGLGGSTNLTVTDSSGRQPLQVSDASSSSSSRDSLDAESSSSSWSSASSSWDSTSASASASLASASPAAAVNNAAGTGMSKVHSWTGDDFENWDYFTYDDPTHGNVNYVSLPAAQSENLVSVQDGKFKMSVATGALTDGNRDSVRISSPENWKKGQLVVASFSHMPEGCGTWPAFWSIGASKAWPAGGEIDILEGVNSVPGNTYTLHTVDGCSVSNSSEGSGLFLTPSCEYQPGCSWKDREDASFGPAFNSAGGGAYAAYFDDDGIKIWFWPVGSVPSSILADSPDMSTFGEAKAFFPSNSCAIDDFFDEDQMLIINTTLMGDWAGATFWDNGCTGTLEATLQAGSNFDNAYWLIDYVKIYGS